MWGTVLEALAFRVSLLSGKNPNSVSMLLLGGHQWTGSRDFANSHDHRILTTKTRKRADSFLETDKGLPRHPWGGDEGETPIPCSFTGTNGKFFIWLQDSPPVGDQDQGGCLFLHVR